MSAAQVRSATEIAPEDMTMTLEPSAFFAQPVAWRSAIDLGILAMAAADDRAVLRAIQAWAPESGAPHRSRRQCAQCGIYGRRCARRRTPAEGEDGGPGAVLGVAAFGLLAAVWIGKTMPTSAFQDFLSILLRAFYRSRSGVSKTSTRGPNAIIALNHVSFLDAPWRSRC